MKLKYIYYSKVILQLILLSLITNDLKAQLDWQPDPSLLPRFYHHSDADSLSFRILDSLSQQEPSQTLYINAKHKTNTFGYCTQEFLNYYWAESDLDFQFKIESYQRNQQSIHYIIAQDTLEWHQLENPGFVWSIQCMQSLDSIRITVDSIVLRDLFGHVDSVKYYTLEHTTGGLVNEQHSITNQQVALSKTKGWIQYFDIEQLYKNPELAQHIDLFGYFDEEWKGYCHTWECYIPYKVGDVKKWKLYNVFETTEGIVYWDQIWIDTVLEITTDENFHQLHTNRHVLSTFINTTGEILEQTNVVEPAIFSFSRQLFDSLVRTPSHQLVAFDQNIRFIRSAPIVTNMGTEIKGWIVNPQEYELEDCEFNKSAAMPSLWIVNQVLGPYYYDSRDENDQINLQLELVGLQSGDFMYGDLDPLPSPVAIYSPKSAALNIAPNPVNDKITYIQLPDVTGGQLWTILNERIIIPSGIDQFTLDLADYPSGVYPIRYISNQGQIYTAKVVIID